MALSPGVGATGPQPARRMKTDGDPHRHRTASRTDCEIETCGNRATETVEHPRRGRMIVCGIHADNIRALPPRLEEVRP